jgi:hypothetical protein
MENNTKNKQEVMFDGSALSVRYDTVEVGETYPIYGMITEFVTESPGEIKVMVNHNIEMTVVIEDAEKLALLKSRCFEPGIFVCTVQENDPTVKCTCTTIVFGKNTCGEVH